MLSMLKDIYGKNIIMLSIILKDNFGIMYVFLFCTVLSPLYI